MKLYMIKYQDGSKGIVLAHTLDEVVFEIDSICDPRTTLIFLVRNTDEILKAWFVSGLVQYKGIIVCSIYEDDFPTLKLEPIDKKEIALIVNTL